jgi:hypothetical protein
MFHDSNDIIEILLNVEQDIPTRIDVIEKDIL